MVENFLLKRKLRNIKEDSIRNCLNCTYNKNNTCYWWMYYKKQSPPKIPNNIINKGCKFWISNNERLHPLLEVIITEFNGEIID